MLLRALLFIIAAAPLLAQPSESPGTGGGPSQQELEGRTLAEEVMAAVGGPAAWNDRNWNISFDFVAVRDGAEASRFSHIWNRRSDTYILNGKDKEGRNWTVNFSDIGKKTGSATVNGSLVADSAGKAMLEMGYGRFINDSYWLLMPFKLLDAGVHHRRGHDTLIGGRTFQTLQLSFGNVGLTPGDRYWLYIDPATKLVERWRFLLQSGREGEFLWTDYRQFGPVKLSLRKTAPDGSFEIRFENVQVTRK